MRPSDVMRKVAARTNRAERQCTDDRDDRAAVADPIPGTVRQFGARYVVVSGRSEHGTTLLECINPNRLFSRYRP
jgi:hypothetical protein